MLVASICVWLVIAAGRVLVLMRKSRRAWTLVPRKKKASLSPYRGESAPIVSDFHDEAPFAVRFAALATSVLEPFVVFEWLMHLSQRDGKPFVSAWAASRAVLARERDASVLAKDAAKNLVLVQVLFASIVFSIAPFVFVSPGLLAVLVGIVVVGSIDAYLLGRGLHDEDLVLKTAAKSLPKESPHEELPEWLSRALTKKAETRTPKIRIEAPTTKKPEPRERVASDDDASAELLDALDDEPQDEARRQMRETRR